MDALETRLDQLASQMIRKDLVAFDGDWSANNAFLPVDAQLFTDDGIELIYPNMGLINQGTIHGQVTGFKKSSEQYKGLAKAKPELEAKMEQNLRKLAIIANSFMRSVTAYPSKFDDANLYYKNGFISLSDKQVECQFVVIVKNEANYINVAFKIEPRKNIQSLPDAPDMDQDSTDILMKMLG